MATIKEIAEKAGVSIGTVDRVLHNRGRVSEETKNTILKLVEELDYRPNNVVRSLAILRQKLHLTFFVIDPKEQPFFQKVLEGAQKEKEKLAQYGVEVEIIPVSIRHPKINIKKLHTDGIAMLPISIFEPVRKYAKKHNTPIVYYNIPSDDGIAYVGCDYVRAGRIVAGLCALLTNGKGKVGILSEGDESVISLNDRVHGFIEEIKTNYPNMKMPKKHYFYVPNKINRLDDLAKEMLKDTPDLDIIYLINPGDYSVCKTIREYSSNPNLKIITNDSTTEQLPYIEDGTISATICQEPERQGEESLEILFQYLTNGSLPNDRDYFTNLSIHIKQNI